MTTPYKTPDGKILVTLIPGDGIGPECVNAARKIIAATGAPLAWEEREAGESVFKKGIPSGVTPETIESVRKTHLVLKGPLGTPVGYGEKSANVTLRKLFETYGNIRPARELPGVKTPYSGRGVDLVVVRENVEDLYAGIEHMQTPGVAQCLKLISRKGCEKIVRLGFEVARAEGRKSVHCATKANIMKLTEGMLKRTFEEIAPEYPDIQSAHIIIDNCAHQLVKKPEQFEVIITTNMNGDIISDLSSALIGGLGFAPSANLGSEVAIFEAVHGSAPKYAGKNVINPTAVLFSAVMMLRYLEMFKEAALIENSVMYTLEEGKVMPRDVVGDARAASTTQYTDAIIANFGKSSTKFKVRDHKPIKMPKIDLRPDFVRVKSRRVAGTDLFVEWTGSVDELGKKAETLLDGTPLRLKMVSSRGTKVYPTMGAITDTVDQFRLRCMMRDDTKELTDELLIALLQKASSMGLHWAHIEKLSVFEGKDGFTKAQGED
ncbi:MAG: NADP-dependent isocitrate dehydrogenase [candidate division Zixibacteria bacterium]|nr:NADP-dependent isocitrate dehydrogenase [candidate division Zixibacteria bacterium]